MKPYLRGIPEIIVGYTVHVRCFSANLGLKVLDILGQSVNH